jgi:DNA polymerase-3 subunit gamma/tau
MLRTFDELGYRQEQRFHFELGLLKLVHLRRLLPIEEALSQLPIAKSGAPSMTGSHPGMGGKITTKPGAPSATKSGAPFMPESHPGMGGVVSGKPAISPFQQDNLRRTPQMSAPIPISAVSPQPNPETRGATAVSLAASAEPTPAPLPIIELAPTLGAASSAGGSIAGQGGVPSLAVPPDPHRAVVEALTAAAQTSAAEALADAAWTIANGEARIQTTLSKTMLPAVFNPEAEKIARSILRDAGILKLTLLPAAAAPAAKKPRPARTGSVQAKALEHPMVQQAKKLFSADLQTVIDLREPD